MADKNGDFESTTGDYYPDPVFTDWGLEELGGNEYCDAYTWGGSQAA